MDIIRTGGRRIMVLAGIIIMGVGLLVIGIGLAFILPYKNVKRLTGSQVQGKIVDMVWDAAMYNRPLDEAAGVEHFKVASMEFVPGTRSRRRHVFPTYVHVGNAGQDPHKAVIGRGTVNMYHKVYQYVVNDREYTRADGIRYNKGVVQSQMGKTVTVYYNPENPQQSTLSNGGGYKLVMIILYVVGGLFLLLGMALLLIHTLI